MGFKIHQQLYKWMLTLKVMSPDGKKVETNKIQLANNLSLQIQNGFILSKIIKNVIKNNKEAVQQSLESIKDANSPQIKLGNWNAIWNTFPALRMQFDTQIKQFILAGDNEMIVEVIKQIYEKYAPQPVRLDTVQNAPQKNQSNVKLTAKNDKNYEKGRDSKKNTQKQKPINNKQSLDITKLNTRKNPADAQSTLEFLILLLCQNLNLPTNQVLGLFTNQNKYLAHVIAKGIKGQFQQVLSFYENVLKYINKLKSLMSEDPKSQNFTLYALKPGFISKSQEVALKTIEVFYQLDTTYSWFVGQGKGLLTFILGLKRHPQLTQDYAKLLIHITQDNFSQFITRYYKTQFQDVNELLLITSQLLSTFVNSSIVTQLQNSGVINEWIQLALQNLQVEGNDKVSLRVSCLKFMSKLWKEIPEYIDEDQEVMTKFLGFFKKQWKQKSFNQFITMSTLLFDLLVQLAQQKNPSAKLIYNSLCNMLSQTLNNQDYRSYLLENFIDICKRFPNIPLTTLIQNFSLIDSLQISDLQFLLNIVQIQSMDLKVGIIIGQLCLKFFQESIVNSLLSNIIVKIIDKFKGQILDFAAKTVKSLMSLLFATEKNKKHFDKKGALYFNKRGTVAKISSDEMQTQMISAQQRALIIELVKKIILINNTPINNKIKSFIVATSVQIKQFNKQGNKGVNGLLSFFGNSKELQQVYIQETKDKKVIYQSAKTFNERQNQQKVRSNSRANVPVNILKHLQSLQDAHIQKKKKIQLQSIIKTEQQEKKKQQIKKQVQKVIFLRGFGGEAQLMDDGYWQKKIQKKQKELQVIQFDVLQQKDIQYIDIILKKYHRVLRQLFLKYTATGFTTKKDLNFDQLGQRTETISLMQIVKFLKDYKLFFLSDLNEIQNLIRDVNIKILKKRETQEFDFSGFQHYIVQYALLVYTKPHTINLKSEGKIISQKKQLKNMQLNIILDNFFNYLRNVFQEKGETTVLFDDPDSAYLNQSQILKQLNKKLESDPNILLPEGFKKIVQKNMVFEPQILRSHNIKESYVNCLEILDQFLCNLLNIHIIEPIGIKNTKVKARPNFFHNPLSSKVQRSQKYLEMIPRNRNLSSAQEQKKPLVLPERKMDKRIFSVGMKIGLSYLPHRDKIIGQQVAYLMQDILNAVQKGKTTIEKTKILNDAVKIRQKQSQQQKKFQEQKQKKRLQRQKELQQKKKQHTEKTQKEQQATKQQKQRLKKEQQKRQKKRKEEKQKQQKQLKEKLDLKKKEEQQRVKQKLQQQKAKKRIEDDQHRKKFAEFNQKQIQKLKEDLKTKHTAEQQKKKKEEQELKNKNEKLKKLKQKIVEEDTKIKYIQQKTNDQISELYNSPKVRQIFQNFENVLKPLYDFLIKSTFLSLTQKKHNNQIIYDTWVFFTLAFRLNPLILDGKQISLIFHSLMRNKQQNKDFILGLDYLQFQQALLRCAIKHKTLFNKISAKIKEGDLTNQQMKEMVKAEEKNEFEETKPLDLNNLLKEDIINNKIIDNYGDISKADEYTLKGLLYYLNLPEDRIKLQNRFRMALDYRKKRGKSYKQQLKQKLKEDYNPLHNKKQYGGRVYSKLQKHEEDIPNKQQNEQQNLKNEQEQQNKN